MVLPAIQGIIQRRLLVNFRADPEVVARGLPAPFEPITVSGYAVVGICLIRLSEVRPRFVPALCGVRSENAAHRIAVRWESGGLEHEGVYIPRRDTSSRLNTLLGGRLFPGIHHPATFQVDEAHGRYDIEMISRDGHANVRVRGHASQEWPVDSIFHGLEDASRFFQRGSLGYSATRRVGAYDGLELRCRQWTVRPVAVESVHSSFFEDPATFPAGSIAFNCALAMRDVEHEWLGRPPLCCDAAVPAIAPT